MTNNEQTERALQLYRAVSFIQNDSQIHWQDKRSLIIDYVHYIVYQDLCRDDGVSMTAQRQASIESRVAKERVTRYFEQRNAYNSSQYLNLLFGKGGWEHVIKDGSISYASKNNYTI